MFKHISQNLREYIFEAIEVEGRFYPAYQDAQEELFQASKIAGAKRLNDPSVSEYLDALAMTHSNEQVIAYFRGLKDGIALLSYVQKNVL